MSTLLGWLLFISFVALIVGLIKPSLFTKLFKEKTGRKRIGLVFGITTFVLLVTAALATPNNGSGSAPSDSQSSAPAQAQQLVAVAPTQESPSPAATPTPVQPKSDEELLQDGVTAAVKNGGSLTTKMNFQAVEVEKSDPDRPSGTKMITAKIDVTDFYDQDALVRDTGRVAASVFRAIYGSNINAYDAFVSYSGQTTDRYGNKTDKPILVYSIDKPTFQKINWQNFDADSFCDFLKQEQRVTTDASANVACNMLVNIQ